ncbi:MAG: DUF2298 domain-containing protein [candidate division FCPU426 bacterium]
MTGIFVWWLLITIMGLAVVPIAFRVFPFLPDRGYAFSKPLGLVLVGLLTWWIGQVHFSVLTILLAFGLIAGLSYWLWVRSAAEFRSLLSERLGLIVAVELFFAVLFLLFCWFRMYNPDIIGTEKFMDLAFLNSLSRATSFPPPDPWMAGSKFFISYYYFGYLLMAILLRLSAVAPAVGFNLSLGMLFALAGISTFGVLYNLTRRLSAGFGGWALIYLIGNLDGFRQVLATKSIASFNWWTPSRVIPDTINEFPFFSFLLGDMHPHMLSIPVVMLTLGFTLNQLKSMNREPNFREPEQLATTLLWGLLIGALGFANSWDLPTTFGLAGAAFLLQQLRFKPRLADLPWRQWGLGLALMLGAMFVPYLPFYFHFHSQAKGLAWTTQNTRLGDFLLLFGVFAYLGLTFLLARYHAWFLAVLSRPQAASGEGKAAKAKASRFCPQCGHTLREGKRICGQCGYQTAGGGSEQESSLLLRPVEETPEWLRGLFLFLLQPVARWRQGRGAALITAGVLAAAVGGALVKGLFFSTPGNPAPVFLGIMIFALAAATLLLFARVDKPETVFALLLLATALALFMGCEVLHINDTFNPPLDRMNTVFKFYYQAWFLLGIAGVYGVFWTWKYSLRHANLKVVWLSGLALLLAASLVYPYAAAGVKTNRFATLPTLDGSAYLNQAYPADRAGIEWLRRSVAGNPVVLEATGGEYTDFARVSTFTGLPTVLGWAGHELQWRGNYDEPGRRIPDIDTLYGSSDVAATQALLDKYQITYVFVGTLERQKYPEEALAKFTQLMDVAFEHPGGVRIYRRR